MRDLARLSLAETIDALEVLSEGALAKQSSLPFGPLGSDCLLPGWRSSVAQHLPDSAGDRQSAGCGYPAPARGAVGPGQSGHAAAFVPQLKASESGARNDTAPVRSAQRAGRRAFRPPCSPPLGCDPTTQDTPAARPSYPQHVPVLVTEGEDDDEHQKPAHVSTTNLHSRDIHHSDPVPHRWRDWRVGRPARSGQSESHHGTLRRRPVYQQRLATGRAGRRPFRYEGFATNAWSSRRPSRSMGADRPSSTVEEWGSRRRSQQSSTA